MKQICSKKVKVSAKYTVNKALEIMHFIKDINSQLFLTKNGMTVHATGLSQLVSFFLMLKEGDSFLCIIEGADAESAMNQMNSKIIY